MGRSLSGSLCRGLSRTATPAAIDYVADGHGRVLVGEVAVLGAYRSGRSTTTSAPWRDSRKR